MAQRVLLVEDDPSLGRTLAERLEREGLTVRWSQTLADARAGLDAQSWDLAIVDVKLPDGSGFGLARQIKKTSTIPVMFMTALNSAENRLEGFEIGAEEYLPKPFHLKEFLIRVTRMLSRQTPRLTVHCGDAIVDFDAMTVETRGGQRAFLQVRDCQVLRMLIEAAPRAVTRFAILDRVWGEDRFPTPRAVDNTIVRLRQALGDTDGRLIRSVRGIGYRWAVEKSA